MEYKSMLDKLNYLQETKEMIRTHLEGKGVEVPVDLPFRDYCDKIDEIKTEDLESKKDLIEMIEAKMPHLEGTMTIDTPWKDIIKYVLIIGPINFKLTDSFEIGTVLLDKKLVVANNQMYDSVFSTEMYVDQINGCQDNFTPEIPALGIKLRVKLFE